MPAGTRRPIRHSALALAAAAAWLLTPDAATGENPSPYQRADDTWISISGEVKAVTPDTFTLDYGDGLVTVEMDDGDRDADAYMLIAGDKVNGGARHGQQRGSGGFTIDTGLRSVRVDVESLTYDPLDDQGYLKIRKGDYVRVTGSIDEDFFEGRELHAESVVKLAG